MTPTKLCSVPTYGTIKELGNITGPIMSPIPLTYEQLILLINKRYLVYEHNPANPSQKVKLTRANLRSTNFEVKVDLGQKIKMPKDSNLTVSRPTSKSQARRAAVQYVSKKQEVKEEEPEVDENIERVVTPDF